MTVVDGVFLGLGIGFLFGVLASRGTLRVNRKPKW